MSAVAIEPGAFHPTGLFVEAFRGAFTPADMRFLDRYLKLLREGRASLRDRILMMAGSDGNYLSAKLGGLAFGKTAYAGETTWFIALYTAAVDDTANGATANEATYTSYARLSLTNNTTIFGAGSGSTTSANQWPSDAIKSWPTSTGGSSTVTYLAAYNGNAGSSADKLGLWASVTSQPIASGDTPQLAQNAITQVRD